MRSDPADQRLYMRDYMRTRRVRGPKVHYNGSHDTHRTAPVLYCDHREAKDIPLTLDWHEVTCGNCLARHHKGTSAWRLERQQRRMEAARKRYQDELDKLASMRLLFFPETLARRRA